MSFVGYDHPKIIPCTMFEHFIGSFKQTDRQTDKQTDGLEHPTHADRQSQRG